MLTKRFLRLAEWHFLITSSFADYAAILQVTANQLMETIRRTMDKPAGKVICERLLLEAKRLPRYSGLSVAEIAYRLKFDDRSYFRRFCKKSTGLSPLDLRHQP